MKKKLMVLGASILQLPAIIEAKNMEVEVIAVDMDKNAIGFKEADICLEVSTLDIPKVLEAAKKYNIDGIMTLASDMPMRTVAAVAKEMGLVGITDDTALKVTDKAIMRQALKDHCVPVPKFFKVSNREEYKVATKQFNLAFIVKPADNSGSRGIFKIDDPTDSNMIAEAYNYSSQFSRNGDVIVEEYMYGSEVSVETLTFDGKCYVIQITDKLTTGAPHFVEMGHSQPTRHIQEIVDRISEVAKSANKALGIINGPSHTEIIVTEDGPKIVELGARLGGDCITTHLVPLSTGLNMVECCIKIALGEQPVIEQKFNKGSAIRYFDQRAGVVKSITGIEEAKKIEGIKQISIIRGIGETVTDIDNSAARMGFVIAQASNAINAIKIAEIGKSKIRIEIKD